MLLLVISPHAFRCFFSMMPRMQRHKHVSCSGTNWECTGTVPFICHCHILYALSSYGSLFMLLCSVNLYICSAWNIQPIAIELDVIVWLGHTLHKEHPQFTCGLPEEHLRTWTKEQRSWIGVFSSAKPQCTERDSGSPQRFFHVMKGPGEPCSTVGKPHFYLLLCSKTSNCRPTSVCFCHC